MLWEGCDTCVDYGVRTEARYGYEGGQSSSERHLWQREEEIVLIAEALAIRACLRRVSLTVVRIVYP